MAAPEGPPYQPRYIDIGINLADPIFKGIYHGTSRHENDLAAVVQRAREVGCSKLIVTGSDFKSSRDALELCKKFPGTVYSTVGIHPCSSSIFASRRPHKDEDGANGSDGPCAPGRDVLPPRDEEPDPAESERVMDEVQALVSECTAARSGGAVVALGEFGLDYDRLHYCSRRVQLHSFAAQLDLVAAMESQLPLFLHSRAAHADFVSLLRAKFGNGLERLEKGGVVHSFTGTLEEMRELAGLGLHIGVNGCSFKTAENCAVVREIPLDRIMLETDGPWCEVRPSHEGWKYLTPRTSRPRGDAGVPKSDSGRDPTTAEDRSAAEQNKGLGREQAPVAAGPKKGGKKQQQATEPRVPERYEVVKKEKWVEGAMVKGRNEPCMIERVAAIVAGIKGISVEEVCEAAWNNTVRVFGRVVGSDGR